jgi:hypothetical protein
MVVLDMYSRLAGSFNEGARINLERWAWQYGAQDFGSAMKRLLAEVPVVDIDRISCPSLFLVSEGESDELKRLTRVLQDALVARGVPVKVRAFSAAEGADCHCQLNNLRLVYRVVFDWMEGLFPA